MTSSPAHWDTSYSGDYTTRGWFQAAADPSWRLIGDLPAASSAIDVGGGASVWVDEALERGWSDLTVLDWSPIALSISQARLGQRAGLVEWVQADLLSWTPPHAYQLWHDRAVLHFLLEESDRTRYASTLRAATQPGSVVVIGAFGPTGPRMCAGLPVRRHSVADFDDLFGGDFTIEQVFDHPHLRPDGDTQDYLWIRAVRV